MGTKRLSWRVLNEHFSPISSPSVWLFPMSSSHCLLFPHFFLPLIPTSLIASSILPPFLISIISLSFHFHFCFLTPFPPPLLPSLSPSILSFLPFLLPSPSFPSFPFHLLIFSLPLFFFLLLFFIPYKFHSFSPFFLFFLSFFNEFTWLTLSWILGVNYLLKMHSWKRQMEICKNP